MLDTFIAMAKLLIASPLGTALVKQLFDYVLFNARLWIHTAAEVQLKLYAFLANELLNHAQYMQCIRRTSAVGENG